MKSRSIIMSLKHDSFEAFVAATARAGYTAVLPIVMITLLLDSDVNGDGDGGLCTKICFIVEGLSRLSMATYQGTQQVGSTI